MWLITTVLAAAFITALWYVFPKIYKLDVLALMFWGTSVMILVDHILGYEGGLFVELETDGLISNATALGLIMFIPIFILWGIIFITSKQKPSIDGGK